MSFFKGGSSGLRPQPNRNPPPLGFRSSDIAAFEKRGSELGRDTSLNIQELAPQAIRGGDVSRAAGEERVNRLVSLFSSRQGEVAQRKRAPGRTLLGS